MGVDPDDALAKQRLKFEPTAVPVPRSYRIEYSAPAQHHGPTVLVLLAPGRQQEVGSALWYY